MKSSHFLFKLKIQFEIRKELKILKPFINFDVATKLIALGVFEDSNNAMNGACYNLVCCFFNANEPV